MPQKLTGIVLVDVVKALVIRQIRRRGPKSTRRKRIYKFLKEFDK